MPPITDSITFRLENFSPNKITVEGNDNIYQVPGAWFRVIDSDHPKKGLEFLLPLKHPEYDESIQQSLLSYNSGEPLTMKCIADNEEQTAWRVYEIISD